MNHRDPRLTKPILIGNDRSVIKSDPRAEVYNTYQICYKQPRSNRGAGSTKSADPLQTDTFKHDVQTSNVSVPYSARQFPMTKGPHAWKKRPRSPGLKWYKDYNSPDSLKKGRILVIDYVKQGKMLLYTQCRLRKEISAKLPRRLTLTIFRLLQRRHAKSGFPRDRFY